MDPNRQGFPMMPNPGYQQQGQQVGMQGNVHMQAMNAQGIPVSMPVHSMAGLNHMQMQQPNMQMSQSGSHVGQPYRQMNQAIGGQMNQPTQNLPHSMDYRMQHGKSFVSSLSIFISFSFFCKYSNILQFFNRSWTESNVQSAETWICHGCAPYDASSTTTGKNITLQQE